MIITKKKGVQITNFVDDYTIIDLETTGFSPEFDSIIELAAVKVRSNEIVDTYNMLVKPPVVIDNFITDLTGISNEMVDDQPYIDELIEPFMDFIQDDVILGHNVSFDIGFLIANRKEKTLSNDYIDTLYFGRRAIKNIRNYKLGTLAKYFGFEENIHRGVDDCLVTKQVYDALKKYCLDKNITLTKKNNNYFNQPKAKDIIGNPDKIDENNMLFEKHCVFTGNLEKMSRKEAMQKIADLGGYLQDSITKSTNYLIIGNLDFQKSKTNKSSKQIKAEKMQSDGLDIQVISENDFYELLNLSKN